MPVLLAEDEAPDVYLMERAFRLAEVPNALMSVPNGQEAIWYLEGEGPYTDRSEHPEPCLMLLDLKMPLVDGFEVLKWIGEQKKLRDRLPVIVLSSSDHEVDVRKAFELGAHEYLVKPSEFEKLVAMVRDLKQGWLEPIRQGQPTPVHARARSQPL